MVGRGTGGGTLYMMSGYVDDVIHDITSWHITPLLDEVAMS